jgi:hypothetical protein
MPTKCRFRDEVGCVRAVCFWPSCVPIVPEEFEKRRCRKVVCPVLLFEDFDSTGCCPLCGTLGEKVDG